MMMTSRKTPQTGSMEVRSRTEWSQGKRHLGPRRSSLQAATWACSQSGQERARGQMVEFGCTGELWASLSEVWLCEYSSVHSVKERQPSVPRQPYLRGPLFALCPGSNHFSESRLHGPRFPYSFLTHKCVSKICAVFCY